MCALKASSAVYIHIYTGLYDSGVLSLQVRHYLFRNPARSFAHDCYVKFCFSLLISPQYNHFAQRALRQMLLYILFRLVAAFEDNDCQQVYKKKTDSFCRYQLYRILVIGLMVDFSWRYIYRNNYRYSTANNFRSNQHLFTDGGDEKKFLHFLKLRSSFAARKKSETLQRTSII